MLITASEKNSLYDEANYVALPQNLYQLVDEAAENKLPNAQYQEFMSIVQQYPTKKSGDRKSFNAGAYHSFKQLLFKVEGCKFSNSTPLTVIGQEDSHSASYLSGFDLGYALNGIVGSAIYKAKQNFYNEGDDSL